MRLAYSHFLGKSLIHFLGTCRCTINRVEFRHLHTFYSLAVGRLHGSTQFLTPFCVAVSKLFYSLIGWLYIHASGAYSSYSLFLYVTQMLLVVLHFLTLSITECTHTLEHFIPIDKCSIKLRPINAHKLCLATNRESAGSAHSGTVNHNGVQ